MRPVRYLTIGAVALTATVLAPVALAQTSGTPPEARALLPASVLATLLQNSVHVAGTVDIGVAGASVGTASVSGDVSWQSQVQGSFQVSSSSPVVTAALGGSPVNLVIVGKKAAVQVGTGAWKCSVKTSGSASTSARAKASTAGSKSKSGKKGKKAKKSGHGSASASGLAAASSTAPMVSALPAFGQPVDLGADTIDGIAVWHVQAKSTAASKTAATLDLYITQSDLTLKRAVLNGASMGAMAASVTATFDLSNYGEPVSVTLPAACTGTTKVVTGAAATWLRVASMLARPRAILAHLGE